MSEYICSTCRKPIDYKNLTAGQCKDCNDDFHPSSIDMIEEILHLKSSNQLLEQRLREAEEVIGFYEEHSKVSGDFDEVPTVTIFSVTGLNHKNSGSGEIHGTYKRYGKRARAYFEKYGEKEGGE